MEPADPTPSAAATDRAVPDPSGALEVLAALPQFRELPRDLLERLARASRRRTLSAGERLFLQGEPAAAFFAVSAGAVRVYRALPDGREQVVHRIRRGQSFGEPAVLGQRVYPVNAMAETTPTELVAVPAGPFLELFRGDVRLAAAIVGALSQRVAELVERVEDLSVVSSSARLARYLLRLPARDRGTSLEVRLPVAKREIAADLAITPETLSRVLARWRARRVVSVRGSLVTVADVGALLAIADRSDAREPAVRAELTGVKAARRRRAEDRGMPGAKAARGNAKKKSKP